MTDEAEEETAIAGVEDLTELAATVAAAETEADLDAIAERVAAHRKVLEETDEDDETAPQLETLEEIEEAIADARGPSPAELADAMTAAAATIEGTRWTDRGEPAVIAAVTEAAVAVREVVPDVPVDAPESLTGATEVLSQSATALAAAGFDVDADRETLASIAEAVTMLEEGLEAAEEWDDLQKHEQLMAEGFYDALGHYKDFPPELSAVRVWEQRGRVDMILLAKETLQSEFMQDHCMAALTRLGDPAALEALEPQLQRRDKAAIAAIGHMGPEGAAVLETLLEYADTDSDPLLQKVTFEALGMIGDEGATQMLADKLVHGPEAVRPAAARALGLIGDPRAVGPLGTILTDAAAPALRGAAAAALRDIATEGALQTLAEHTEDPAPVVAQHAAAAAAAIAITPSA
jgi:hypothetical protein